MSRVGESARWPDLSGVWTSPRRRNRPDRLSAIDGPTSRRPRTGSADRRAPVVSSAGANDGMLLLQSGPMTGPFHRHLMLGCLLAGAVFVTSADLVSRLVIEPIELPVGLVTSVFGGPVFLWIVSRRRGGA